MIAPGELPYVQTSPPGWYRRLRRSMNESDRRLKDSVDQHAKFLKAIAGDEYANSGADPTPVNFLSLATSIYTRFLASRNPNVMVRSKRRELVDYGDKLKVALDHLIKEISLGRTLAESVMQAMTSMGIVKIGITDSDRDGVDGYEHDAGQIYVDPVYYEDWFHDMNARRLEAAHFMGNWYRLPVDYVRSSDIFKNKRDLMPDNRDESSGLPSNRFSSLELSMGKHLFTEDYRDMYDLGDVWLPYEQVMVTVHRWDENRGPLVEKEWDGPEGGPYSTLGFGGLPGNVVAKPPCADWYQRHALLNTLFTKLSNQALEQKSIGIATRGAAGDGEEINKTKNGQMVTVDNPGEVQEMSFGGPDQLVLAFMLQLKQLFSYFGGNIDVIGGLSSAAPTLGQEQLMQQGSTQRLNDMQDATTDFTREIIRKMAWYEWYHPDKQMIMDLPIDGLSYDIEFEWSSETREGDLLDYFIELHPHSTRSRTPGEVMQSLHQLTTQVLLPLQQAGATQLDVDKLIAEYVELADLKPELRDVVKAIDPATLPQQQNGSGRAMQSPVTTRNYNRTSQGQQQNPDEQLMLSLMGQGGQVPGAN